LTERDNKLKRNKILESWNFDSVPIHLVAVYAP